MTAVVWVLILMQAIKCRSRDYYIQIVGTQPIRTLPLRSTLNEHLGER
jgi:hypothetical protein